VGLAALSPGENVSYQLEFDDEAGNWSAVVSHPKAKTITIATKATLQRCLSVCEMHEVMLCVD
jgi:hypothetical protein